MRQKGVRRRWIRYWVNKMDNSTIWERGPIEKKLAQWRLDVVKDAHWLWPREVR